MDLIYTQGRFCLYKLNQEDDEDWDDDADPGHLRVNRGIPPNNQIQVLIRVYIISVRPLHLLEISLSKLA